MRNIIDRVRHRLVHEEGQTLTEYSLIIAFIALAVVTAVAAKGTSVLNMYQSILDAWPA